MNEIFKTAMTSDVSNNATQVLDTNSIYINEDIKEMFILFSPGPMDNEIIKETEEDIPKITKDVVLETPEIGNKISNAIIDITDALEKAAVILSEDKPVFKDTDCENNDDIVRSCNIQTIDIIGVKINDNQKIDGVDGHIEPSSYSSDADSFLNFAYYPESKLSNNYGMIALADTDDRYKLDIPYFLDVADQVISEVCEEFGENSSTVISEYMIDNKFRRIKTTVTYEDNNDEILKITNIKTMDYYYNSNYEILFTFSNEKGDITKELLGILDIHPKDDITSYSRTKFNNSTKYPYVFDMKEFIIEIDEDTVSNIFSIILSKDRILELAKPQLVYTGLLENTAVNIINQLNANNTNEVDPCLLDNTESSSYKETEVNTTKIQEELKKVNSKIQDTISLFDDIDISSNDIIKEDETIIRQKNNYPVFYLNEEYDIGLYIINGKLQIQLPPNILNKSRTKNILDCEIIPGKKYFLHFKINLGSYEIELLTEDKKYYKLRSTNFSNIDIFPKKIAADNDSIFCGFILYDIIFGNGRMNNLTKLYKRSLLGYKPRTSQLYFNFESVKEGKLSNTITSDTGLDNKISSQQANVYGNILTNGFTNCLEGMVDNFFCRDILTETSFSICFWFRGKQDKNNSKHVLLSDDIGNNTIYYENINSLSSKIYIELGGVSDILLLPTTLDEKWSLLTFSYELYSNNYRTTIQPLNTSNIYSINTEVNNPFRLMSIFSRYSYKEKEYIDNFEGYLTLISIYFSKISNLQIKELFKEQSIFVNGLMDESIKETTSNEVNNNDTENIQLLIDDKDLFINNQSNLDYLSNIAGFNDNMDKHDLEKLLKGR